LRRLRRPSPSAQSPPPDCAFDASVWPWPFDSLSDVDCGLGAIAVSGAAAGWATAVALAPSPPRRGLMIGNVSSEMSPPTLAMASSTGAIFEIVSSSEARADRMARFSPTPLPAAAIPATADEAAGAGVSALARFGVEGFDAAAP